MDGQIPTWPSRISREDARTAKERAKLFAGAVKAEAKVAGWQYANGGMFRKSGDWFISVLPSLLWGRGATAMLLGKPMAVDPVFWNIVGLPENERRPLSFRANGAWVLRPPSIQAHISLMETDPERLASDVVIWATEQLREIGLASVDSFLLELRQLGDRRKNFAALEICLDLLRDDYEGALSICKNSSPGDSGGFTTGTQTFFDQARDWIAKARRDEFRPV